jgi:hypothetical protein
MKVQAKESISASRQKVEEKSKQKKVHWQKVEESIKKDGK